MGTRGARRRPPAMPPEPTEIDGFRIPRWWRCQWQRQGCGKNTCPLCGPIHRARRRHLARGEDPDSLPAVLADVAESFTAVMAMVRADAQRLGIDLDSTSPSEAVEPPKPEAFPLYRLALGWYRRVCGTSEGLRRQHGESWTRTAAAQDLHWYACLLPVKVYRWQSSRWERDRGISSSVVDERYTGYVVSVALHHLNAALRTLVAKGPNPAAFLLLAAQLGKLEPHLAPGKLRSRTTRPTS